MTNINEVLFCIECGAIRPNSFIDPLCIPCAKRGHLFRLINLKEAEQRVIQLLNGKFTDKAKLVQDRIKKVKEEIKSNVR